MESGPREVWAVRGLGGAGIRKARGQVLKPLPERKQASLKYREIPTRPNGTWGRPITKGVSWGRSCDGIELRVVGAGSSSFRAELLVAMKEEKDHRPKEKRVTLLTPPGATGSGGGASGDSTKGDDKQDRNKEKKEALSKVLDRSLAGERAGCVRPWEWGCLLPLLVSF